MCQWRKAQASLPETKFTASLLQMIPTALKPVLDLPSTPWPPTPHPRQSATTAFRRLGTSPSCLFMPSPSQFGLSLSASKCLTTGYHSSHPTPYHNPSGSTLRLCLPLIQSPPPFKCSRLAHPTSSLVLALDSEVEVAALLKEPDANGGRQIEGLSQDYEVDHKISHHFSTPNLEDNTLSSFQTSSMYSAQAPNALQRSCSVVHVKGSSSLTRLRMAMMGSDRQKEAKLKWRMSDLEPDLWGRGTTSTEGGMGNPYIFNEPSWVCVGGQYVAPKWIHADLFHMDNQ